MHTERRDTKRGTDRNAGGHEERGEEKCPNLGSKGENQLEEVMAAMNLGRKARCKETRSQGLWEESGRSDSESRVEGRKVD